MTTVSSSLITPKPPNWDPHLHHRLITTLNSGHLRRAISTLHLMSQRGTHPDLPTFSLFLKSCIRSRRFDIGEIVHNHLIASELELDSLTLNSLLSLYSKSGHWEKAKQIFDSMGEKRNSVSWTSMVSCFANNGMGFEALLLFVDMINLGFSPNEYCLSAAIRACTDLGDSALGRAVFGLAVKSGWFESDLCVGCALIDMFAKGFADLGNAYKVFEKMPERNAVAWTLMITRFSQFGLAREAVELFLEMLDNGIVADEFTFSTVLSACAELGFSSLGKQLHSLVVRFGFDSDRCVGSGLVDMYAKCGKLGSLEDARKVFYQMESRNVVSWTALINGYAHIGGRDFEAIEMFREMISGFERPNHFTFSSVLKACANLSDLSFGKQVHGLAVKQGFDLVNCVGNSLISMYAQCGWIEDSRRVFDVMHEKNLVSYNAIVDAYAKNFESDEAFNLLNEIDELGLRACAFTYSSLLSGAASIGAISKGEQIHSRVLKSGFGSNQTVSNALISMYSKCGNIEAAFQVFNGMTDRNIVSRTAIITGFSKHGQAERALTLFHEMLDSRTKPNEITYTAVLSACSHSGLVSEGLKHFNSMHPKHGIVPRMEHYACIVDLLGRSGRLSEALEFINSMPFAADALIWRTFLGACRIPSNLDLGNHAANMILEKEPDNPTAFVLLSNLYAAANQWDEVTKLRTEMKARDLVKEAGSSWLEVGNKMHKFHVGDTRHPRATEIYDELGQLVSKIKELGYVPNTDFVLHDVEEEEKEKYLFQHSEKIAVAFGLISTSQPKPIRVFKNLRICGDCHDAMKYISVATGREIIVRDSNRFHHIKNGTCSCRDYW